MPDNYVIPFWLGIVILIAIPIIIPFLTVWMQYLFDSKRQSRELEARKRTHEFAVGQAILGRTLDSMQTAFMHIMKINIALDKARMIYGMSESATSTGADKEYKMIEECFTTARDFHDRNCFNLPRQLRKTYLIIVHLGAKLAADLYYGANRDANIDTGVWENLNKMIISLEDTSNKFMDKYSLFEVLPSGDRATPIK